MIIYITMEDIELVTIAMIVECGVFLLITLANICFLFFFR